MASRTAHPAEPDDAFTVTVLDEQGKSVSGAEVGIGAYFGNMNYKDTGWHYLVGPVMTNDSGDARFEQGRALLSHASLVARHRERGLMAVANRLAADDERSVQLTIVPPCRVTTRVTCKQLESRGESLPGAGVTLGLNGQFALEYHCKDASLAFDLPHGVYEFRWAGGSFGVHRVTRNVTVPFGQRALDLGTIDLPLTRLKLLEGQPAPEIRDVLEWKNADRLTLAELRGKVVLLDFLGWWCPGCLTKMPKLFDLHDKYASDGLVIVGVHIDAGDEVLSVAQLDERLTSVRNGLWKERDIPFPVALVREGRIPRAPGVGADARAPVAADYGVTGYPTMVLIDRQGLVVGPFSLPSSGLGGHDIAQLERLLADR